MMREHTWGKYTSLSNKPVFTLRLACLLGMLCSLSSIQAQDVHQVCGNLSPSPALRPFIQELTIPREIDITDGDLLVLGAYRISQSVHPDLPNTTFYAYGRNRATATYPGPTLVAEEGEDSRVRFENHITGEHFLTIDKTLHWADPPRGGVPIITHLHGADTESKYDGHPEAWYTAAGDRGPAYVTNEHHYPNEQPASLLWYHDHSLGMTRVNMAAGLAGLYILREDEEVDGTDDLPEGEFEIPLLIQDKQFFPNGSINFPDIGAFPAFHPNWCPGYFGDTMLVNGKAWPFKNVYPKIYRMRILNGANARVFTLTLSNSNAKMIQIGTDGGYLHEPIALTSLTIAPAYRVDVLFDFRNVPIGTAVYLNNSAPAPFPDGLPVNSPPSTTYIMKFNVIKVPVGKFIPTQRVPTTIGKAANFSEAGARFRNVTLNNINPPNLTFLLNNNPWSAEPTEIPTLYTTEIWDITHLINGGIHPIHIHLVNFLMIHQQAFNKTLFDQGFCSLNLRFGDPFSCFTEAPQPPDNTQVGWKDTIIVNRGTVARLLIRFKPREMPKYPFDPTTFPGYVWHCHILDHEDNDMMRPLPMVNPKV